MLGAWGIHRRAVAGVTSMSRELDGFCLLGADYTRVQPHSGWVKSTVANFRDAALKADPDNAVAIQSAFALDMEICCGDGFVDPGERCDGNCPTSCDDHDPQTKDEFLDARTCQARCVHTLIESVGSGSPGASDVVVAEAITPQEEVGQDGGGCNTTGSHTLGNVILLITLSAFVSRLCRGGSRTASPEENHTEPT
jgi:hypothetical protein